MKEDIQNKSIVFTIKRWHVFMSILGLLILWYTLYYIAPILFVFLEESGDIFNAISSLFGGLAFLGLIFTILIQSRQLELQRKELIEQRKELQLSRETQQASQKEFGKQAELMGRAAILNSLNALVDI